MRNKVYFEELNFIRKILDKCCTGGEKLCGHISDWGDDYRDNV